jgi:hypothetical protein
MAERRHGQRISCHADGHIDGLDVGRVHALITDLGVGGVHVDTRTNQPVGQRGILSFTLIDREVTAEIEVIYTVSGRGMGVRFINLSPSERALIRSLVEADGRAGH